MSVEKKARFSIWYVLLGVWVVLLIQNMLISAFSIERIPYSRFLKILQEGKITEIAVSQNTIEGRIRGDGATPEKAFRTVRVDPDFSKELEKYGVTFKGEVENTFFRDLLSWILPVLMFVGIWYFMIRRIGGQQPGFMTLGKNKAKIYVEEDLDVRFSDVAGVEEAKEELGEIIEFLRYPQKYTELGGKMPKGVLLLGPPGSGKTLLAKAVAGESHVPFFNMSGSEFVEMFVGLGAARVRDLFTQAKSKAPCIIFVDELNKYTSTDIPKNSPILRQILDITERGRSLGIILFSAEQFKSAIHDRVKGNCSTHAFGRTNAIEISKRDYRFIPSVYKNMMTRLSPGEYIIENPIFRSLLNIKFPNPLYKQF